MRPLLFSALLVLFPRGASAAITVTTTTTGSNQVNGYFNETNSISVKVDIDNTTTSDLTTYGSGGIYLEIAWDESGTPSSFSTMSSPATVAFSSGTATITAENSHLTATNANPDQDNLDLRVVLVDKLVGISE